MKIKHYLFCCSLIFVIALVINGCSSNKTNGSLLPKPTSSAASNITVSPTISTNIPEEIGKIDETFLKGLGITIKSNYELRGFKAARLTKLLGYEDYDEMSYQTKIKLPKDFKSVINKVEIGKLLLERNKQSKEYGLDFSNYMGKELFLYDKQVIKGNTKAGYILILFDADKMVGMWHDESNENNDVNQLLSSGVIIKQSN